MKWCDARGWCGSWVPVFLASLLFFGPCATITAAEGLTDKMHELMREQELRDQQKPRPQPPPQRPDIGHPPDPLPGRRPPMHPPQVKPAPPPPPPIHRPEPERRPPVVHHDPPPSRHHRPGNSWRRDRCWDLWGGRGAAYHRCLDGRHEYLYPAPRYERAPSVYLEAPPPVIIEAPPPPVIRYRQDELPANLLAERFPVWYAPRVTAAAVITAQDPDRNDRSFHLVGILPGGNVDLLDECLARSLNDARVQINEIAPYSSVRDADAEAVVFVGGDSLNVQILAEGCAQFDDRGCRDLGLDICDLLLDAEHSARKNGLGIWR